jgi:hypothetical protein
MGQKLTESEKLRVMRDARRTPHANATTGRSDTGTLACESDRQPTLLARAMTLRNMSPATAAANSGVHITRIESIAAGKSKPESYEKAGLEKTFHDDAELLAAANTPENRAKLKPLI